MTQIKNSVGIPQPYPIALTPQKVELFTPIHYIQTTQELAQFPYLQTQPNFFGLSKIEELVRKLSELEGIEIVKPIFQDVHSVTFKIKLFSLSEHENFDEDDIQFHIQIESNNLDEIWTIAQNLVLKTCSDLRDITGEKWYFFTKIVEDFSNPALEF
ncbi:hypothetical protein [Nostoc sp.]|uniref:hypothetical protein n=1 Tax=Nostoc sp. TaxID=1180 RepID=UPI002FF67F67